MLLIVDAPTYQRWQTEGMTPTQGERPGRTPKTSPGEGSLSSQISGRAAGGWYPQMLGMSFPCLTLFTYLVSGGGTPVDLLGPLAGPFLVSRLMTLVSTAVVQMHGSLTIQALDVIEGDSSARCMLWCEAPQGAYPHPSHPLTHLPYTRGTQGPGCQSDSLFHIQVGLAPLGPGIQYSPISGESPALGAWGPASTPPLTRKAKLMEARWRAIMSHRPPRY